MESTLQRIAELEEQYREKYAEYNQINQQYSTMYQVAKNEESEYIKLRAEYDQLKQRQTNLKLWKEENMKMRNKIAYEKENQMMRYKKLEQKNVVGQYGNLSDEGINLKINEAASLLVKNDQEASKLKNERELLLRECRMLQSDITSLIQDKTPIREQTEKVLINYRKENQNLQSEIDKNTLNNVIHNIQYHSQYVQLETDIDKINHERKIAEAQYLKNCAILKSQNYIISIMKGDNITEEEIFNHIQYMNNLLPVIDEESTLITKSKDIRNKMMGDRQMLIQNINNLIENIKVTHRIKDEIHVSTNKCLTDIDLIRFDQQSLMNENNGTRQQKSAYETDISTRKNEVDYSKNYIATLQKDLDAIEEQFSITKEKMEELKQNYDIENQKLQLSANQVNEKRKARSDLVKHIMSDLKTISHSIGDSQSLTSEVVKVIEHLHKEINDEIRKSEYNLTNRVSALKIQLKYAEKINGKASEEHQISNLNLIKIINEDISLCHDWNLKMLLIKKGTAPMLCDALFSPFNNDKIFPYSLIWAIIRSDKWKNHFSSFIHFISSVRKRSVRSDYKERKPDLFVFGKFPLQNQLETNQNATYICDSIINYIDTMIKVFPTFFINSGIHKNKGDTDLFDELVCSVQKMKNLVSIPISSTLSKLKKMKDIQLSDVRWEVPTIERTIRLKDSKFNESLLCDLKEKYIIESFSYIQFEMYRKIQMSDVNSYIFIKTKIAQSSPSKQALGAQKSYKLITEFEDEQNRAIYLLAYSLINSFENDSANHMYEYLKRKLINIAKRTLARQNYFLFVCIMEAFKKALLFISDNDFNSDDFDSMMKLYENKEKLFEEMAKEGNKEKILFIPDISILQKMFDIVINTPEIEKNVDNNHKIPMKFYRKLAECGSVFFRGSDSDNITFNINKSLVLIFREAKLPIASDPPYNDKHLKAIFSK